jgi:hypothetical protein
MRRKLEFEALEGRQRTATLPVLPVASMTALAGSPTWTAPSPHGATTAAYNPGYTVPLGKSYLPIGGVHSNHNETLVREGRKNARRRC